jgi:glutamate-1-semialdehyde 2,1-aminomutase
MQALYRDLDATWAGGRPRSIEDWRARPAPAGRPPVVDLDRLPHQASRYNGCCNITSGRGPGLSWIGTGRLVFSLNFSDADFEAVAERFLAAAEAMRRDGWWETGALGTDRAIKRRILREMLATPRPRACRGRRRPTSSAAAR